MEFKFEIMTDGSARLVKAEGKDKVVSLPDVWNDHPVTAIGEYAFYEQREMTRIRLPRSMKVIGDHAFAECRFLEQIEFPKGTERIDDYAFYNCTRLARVVLPGTLTHMGYGAFRNDSDLRDIHLYTVQGMESQINTILSDTNFELTVTFHYKDGNVSQLVFTDFFYEETANEEARQFNHKTYGSGSLYRNCISSTGIDYMKYDEIFELTIHRDEPTTVMDLALKRLSYPYELASQARRFYIDYLKSMGAQVLFYMVETKRWYLFSLLTEGEPLPKGMLDAGIEFGQKNQVPEFVSMLMQYKNVHYSSMKKTFDL